jgi:hypothetical protein
MRWPGSWRWIDNHGGEFAAAAAVAAVILIDGVARAFGGAEATAVRRRKRGSPAGGQWDKAVTGVMVSRF